MRYLTRIMSWVRPQKLFLGNDAYVGRLRWALVVFLHVVLLAGFLVWTLDFGETRTRVMLGAGPKGSESYQFASALAEVASRHVPGVQVIPLGTEGSERNAALLASGDIDMAIIHSNAQTAADSRLVVNLYHDYAHFIVAKNSGIRLISDLAGKRIAVPPKGSGGFEMFWLLLDYYRIDETDITALPMSWHAAELAFSRGAVDALFTFIAPGNQGVFKLIEMERAEVIGVDLAQGVVLREPELEIHALKRGTYGDKIAVPASDIQTIAVKRLLIAGAGLPPTVISRLTALMFERRRELMALAPLAASVHVPKDLHGSLMPLHEGARAYLERDEPSFLQENAEVIALGASGVIASASAIFSLLGRRKRKRIDQYNRELVTMTSMIGTKQTLKDLEKLKARLQALVGEIVRDTERGYISNEAFEFFAFTWRATEAAIRDREQNLISAAVHSNKE